jgi:methylthioribose-1-phosphate isomerase
MYWSIIRKTNLKALFSRDNNIPFFVALASSSIDFSIFDG